MLKLKNLQCYTQMRVLCCAVQVDPNHLHVWQAWGCMEYRQQKYDTGEPHNPY